MKLTCYGILTDIHTLKITIEIKIFF